ncbi:translation initiation factor IF-2-like [Canis lupus dingo]|uniref:translation initiation factor IF-2-like n=1 Tax=Canis lupus dingo TaxID=286419 RepID=UPI0020C3AAA3|nr:translation initiation factor IF-2-like [Canis lupus dingo]
MAPARLRAPLRRCAPAARSARAPCRPRAAPRPAPCAPPGALELRPGGGDAGRTRPEEGAGGFAERTLPREPEPARGARGGRGRVTGIPGAWAARASRSRTWPRGLRARTGRPAPRVLGGRDARVPEAPAAGGPRPCTRTLTTPAPPPPPPPSSGLPSGTDHIRPRVPTVDLQAPGAVAAAKPRPRPCPPARAAPPRCPPRWKQSRVTGTPARRVVDPDEIQPGWLISVQCWIPAGGKNQRVFSVGDDLTNYACRAFGACDPRVLAQLALNKTHSDPGSQPHSNKSSRERASLCQPSHQALGLALISRSGPPIPPVLPATVTSRLIMRQLTDRTILPCSRPMRHPGRTMGVLHWEWTSEAPTLICWLSSNCSDHSHPSK